MSGGSPLRLVQLVQVLMLDVAVVWWANSTASKASELAMALNSMIECRGRIRRG